MEAVSEDLLDIRIRIGDHFLPRHAARRDRPGLIAAQRIHTRQRLDAVQLLHQRILTGQVDRAHCQRDAGQQHEPLRDHAQHRRHRGRDGIIERGMRKEQLLSHQQQPHRYDDDAHGLDDEIDRITQL